MSNSAIDIFGAYSDNFKNKLINGNFDFWQRGRCVGATFNQSISTSVGDTELYLADRWFRGYTSDVSTTFGFTAERGNFSESDFGISGTKIRSRPKHYISFSAYLAIKTGSEQYTGLGQRIERARTLSNKQATLSFWAKGSVTGNASVRISQYFGTGGGASERVDLTQRILRFLSADSWARYTFTFEIPSIAGKTLGTSNDDYLEVFVANYNSWGFAGLTGTVNSGATIDYAGTISLAEVQLEEGPSATFFDNRMPGVELAMCERYFETGIVDYAVRGGATGNYIRIPFRTPKKPFKYVIDDFISIPTSGNTLETRFDGVSFESDTYTVYHSIAGISGADGVPLDGDEGLSADQSGITHVAPDGFSVWFNRTTDNVGHSKVRGLWAVDAEL